MRAISLVGMLALGACGNGVSPTQPSDDHGAAPVVAWASEGEAGACSTKLKAVDNPLSLIPGQEICLGEFSKPVQVSGLRFVPRKEGQNRLLLRCDDGNGADFLSSRNGKVFLVSRHEVLAGFVVADGTQGGCALNVGDDMLEALSVCEDMAEALGFKPEGCSSVCKTGDEEVCIPVRG